MNPPAKFTDDDVESLLRATFSAEARGRVPESRPVPPFPAADRLATVHPLRRRWTGIALVAAALVAVLAGALVVGDQVMDSKRAPVPAGTSVAPAPTDTATVASPTPTTPSTTATTSTTTPPSSPPATTTKQVTFNSVVLTVPTTWNVVDRPVGETGAVPSVCLTTDTAIHTTGSATYNCQLSVSVGAALWGGTDVDRVGFAPDGGLCGTDHHRPHQTDTVVADELTIDGHTAEHRGFTGSCLDQVLDQWTVPTAPFVQFWRDYGPPDPAGRSQALEVVKSAQLLGPRSTLRLSDRGIIRAVSGDTLSLDRVTDLNQLGVENNNPATYDYPLAASAVIRYDGSTSLSIDQLRALAAGQTVAGVPPLDQLTAELTTDGSTVTEVDLS